MLRKNSNNRHFISSDTLQVRKSSQPLNSETNTHGGNTSAEKQIGLKNKLLDSSKA